MTDGGSESIKRDPVLIQGSHAVEVRDNVIVSNVTNCLFVCFDEETKYK